jgi:hypothetical protein
MWHKRNLIAAHGLIGAYSDLLEIPSSATCIRRVLQVAHLELKAVLLNAGASRQRFLQTPQTAAIIASDHKEALK